MDGWTEAMAALCKVKEVCRHSYSLSHENSGKNVLCIRDCLLKRKAMVTVASHVAPQNILVLGPPKAMCRAGQLARTYK